MPRHSGGRSPGTRRVRVLALAGVVAGAVALPLAVASAGPVGHKGRSAVRAAVRDAVRAPARDAVGEDAREGREAAREVREGAREDRKAPSGGPLGSPRLLGVGLATATRCGPELASPDGIEAQTCVLTQGEDTWARTYYRNVTGDALDAVLSLMGPAGRTVLARCALGAEDDPGMCETPREHTRGNLDAYTAVAEFAQRAGRGPLLLRSGSNSGAPTGS